jgi:putative two-component system response regulator
MPWRAWPKSATPRPATTCAALRNTSARWRGGGGGAAESTEKKQITEFLTERNIVLLAKSAPLHDIGKVGIPDHILLKPGKLTPEEWRVMKTHARLGAEAIELAERDAERPVEFLALAKDIAHHHHERWDGGGYPDGLAGEAIPLAARFMAIADVYDAIISPRVYKPPMPFERAREIIASERGRQFDPDLTDAFLDGYAEFGAIARRYRDSEAAVVAKEAAVRGEQPSRPVR